MQREKIVQLQDQDFHSHRLDATWPGGPGPNPRLAVWAQDTTTDWPWWASTPLRSPNLEEPRSGEMPVYSWTECKQPVGFARTFSATAQQLAHVKKGVNGSKHWHFFKTCWREVYVMISLATTRQSVHARRGVNGNEHWPCSRNCPRQQWVPMSLATMQPSLRVRRVVNGSRHCFCFRSCLRWDRPIRYPQIHGF